MRTILNISAYKFIELADAKRLQPVLLERAMQADLKGTVLLASEGINLFLAGAAERVRGWVAQLRRDPRFADLDIKESWSDRQPFRRIQVKLKPEIIRMNHPTIRPTEGRAPAVLPGTLRRWLDRGSDDHGVQVVTLDTRNAFEVDWGGFVGAIDWRLEKFSDFPRAAKQHLADLHGKTVVAYCTGGIRCEKAAIYLQQLGAGSVFQLDGGILKYFENEGGAHFRGDCFVFDERVRLNDSLSEPENARVVAAQ